VTSIAVVDDAPDIVELLKYTLEDFQDVATFTNPQQFIDEFEAGKFALVLLDIVMPEVDGLAVLREIRKRDKTVPVVALSGCALPAEQQAALIAGFSAYIIKPIVDLDQFRAVLDSHINGDGR
jgi:CheY-like chemotaxis protein